jgi:hypothetical protein
MHWTMYDKSSFWRTQNKVGDYISINIMNGIYLVNGSPPTVLHFSIQSNELFSPVFGDTAFEVTIDNNGISKAQNPVRGHYYSSR